MSDQDSTTLGTPLPAGREGEADRPSAPPALSVGDTIVFKYEGNLRAKFTGYETVGEEQWLSCRASLDFLVPPSQVVGVQPEE
jgi:hypothetical protein